MIYCYSIVVVVAAVVAAAVVIVIIMVVIIIIIIIILCRCCRCFTLKVSSCALPMSYILHDSAQFPCTGSLAVIGVDLTGILGGRMASAEGRSVPSGVRYGRGVPSPAD